MAAQPPERLFKWLGLNIQGDLGPLTMYTSRRGKLVVYGKAPPLTPPTQRQTTCRNKFRLVASLWRLMTKVQKTRWNEVEKRAHLGVTGYDLFTYYTLTHDRACIRTLEGQTGIKLLD